MAKYTSWFEKSCLIGRIGRHFVAKEHRGIVLFDRGMLGGASTFCRNSFEVVEALRRSNLRATP